ncbi:MAG: DUF4270 domain-containing protein, partial [Flavobacteriaceae bacterium]|nr:DUF4270 domain-containing protein [Flavobacteriaceae bacterium]
MKTNLPALRNFFLFSLLLVFSIACDRDFSEVDSDIIDANAAHFDTRNNDYNIITYNRKLGPVQTNGLPLNLLGYFNDPLYGPTTASFVSQVNIPTLNPNFGNNPVLDSVVLTIPYFSSIEEVVEQQTIYELDSVYGNDPIKLSIYENKFFLRDFDPNGENINTPQTYFSNGSYGTGEIPQSLLEGTLLEEIEEFVPSNGQIILVDEDSVVTRVAPALRIKLDNEYWQEKILDKQGQTELSNANNFYNFFRGLYFKAEAINGSGNLSLLNFGSDNTNITLYYTRDSNTEEGEPVENTYTLNFSGNRVNFFSPLEFEVPEPNTEQGDERLYLKGLQGSMGVVELFSGTDLDDSPEINEFEAFKNEFVFTDEEGKFVKAKRLVNEANLVFYVDQTIVDGNEPERIYIYDLKNNIPLVDFVNEPSNTVFVNDSRTGHLGRLQREGGEPD